MATAHGSKARAYVRDRNLSGYLRGVKIGREVDTADVSTLIDEDRRFIAGLESGKLDLDGLLDPAIGAIEELLRTYLGTSMVGIYLPQGDALGNAGYGIEGLLVSDEAGTSLGEAGVVTAEIQSDRSGERIVSLHPLGSEAASGNGTGVDQTASSAAGGVGYLLVSANTRPASSTLKIQHSVDNSVWADLITFTAIGASAVGGERMTVAGTVNRYVRALWTPGGASGSITFFIGFSRL